MEVKQDLSERLRDRDNLRRFKRAPSLSFKKKTTVLQVLLSGLIQPQRDNRQLWGYIGSLLFIFVRFYLQCWTAVLLL